MPVIHAKRRVNHSAQEMFDLVADVERYPEFVPHCQKHVIVSRGKRGDHDLLVTDMTMARGNLSRDYSRAGYTRSQKRPYSDRGAGRSAAADADGVDIPTLHRQQLRCCV